ncbi:MAG: hypothetical protein ACE37E_01045 [Hyphomicrobiales bacterium]
MTEQEAAWAALALETKQQIVNSKSRDELREACMSPAYTALRSIERGPFYEQVKEAAQEKAAKYRVVP